MISIFTPSIYFFDPLFLRNAPATYIMLALFWICRHAPFIKSMRQFLPIKVVINSIFAWAILKKIKLVSSRHHAEPNNTLLTRNLPFNSDVRQQSHPLMIPLNCLWDKSNNRTHGQFECDLVLFLFWFSLFICTVRLFFLSF